MRIILASQATWDAVILKNKSIMSQPIRDQDGKISLKINTKTGSDAIQWILFNTSTCISILKLITPRRHTKI